MAGDCDDLKFLILHGERPLRNAGRLSVLANRDAFADYGDLGGGAQLLHLFPIHRKIAENIAFERDGGTGGAHKMAFQFVPVGEDDFVRRGFVGLGYRQREGGQCEQDSNGDSHSFKDLKLQAYLKTFAHNLPFLLGVDHQVAGVFEQAA